MPAVTKYQDTLADAATGRPVANATVTVANYPSGTPATLYSEDGTTVSTASIITDANGFYYFYAVPGQYNITINSGPLTRALTDVLVGPFGAGSGGDPLTLYNSYGISPLVPGSLDSSGNLDAPTLARVALLVALGIPQSAISVAVAQLAPGTVLTPPTWNYVGPIVMQPWGWDATINFTSVDATATVQASVDGAAYLSSVTVPSGTDYVLHVSGLSQNSGDHTYALRVTDSQGTTYLPNNPLTMTLGNIDAGAGLSDNSTISVGVLSQFGSVSPDSLFDYSSVDVGVLSELGSLATAGLTGSSTVDVGSLLGNLVSAGLSGSSTVSASIQAAWTYASPDVEGLGGTNWQVTYNFTSSDATALVEYQLDSNAWASVGQVASGVDHTITVTGYGLNSGDHNFGLRVTDSAGTVYLPNNPLVVTIGDLNVVNGLSSSSTLDVGVLAGNAVLSADTLSGSSSLSAGQINGLLSPGLLSSVGSLDVGVISSAAVSVSLAFLGVAGTATSQIVIRRSGYADSYLADGQTLTFSTGYSSFTATVMGAGGPCGTAGDVASTATYVALGGLTAHYAAAGAGGGGTDDDEDTGAANGLGFGAATGGAGASSGAGSPGQGAAVGYTGTPTVTVGGGGAGGSDGANYPGGTGGYASASFNTAGTYNCFAGSSYPGGGVTAIGDTGSILIVLNP